MKQGRSPAVFVSHGSPLELIQKGPWQLVMESIGREVLPRAVIIMSAHYKSSSSFDVGFCKNFSTIHDFSGFPDELNRFVYPAKGDHDLSDRCVELLHGASIPSALNTTRGLDHGSYVPTSHMWPKANVPIIPLSISAKATPSDVFRVGEIIAPLRNEDVMILGSGGMVHNLGELSWEKPGLATPEDWATSFQSWVLEALRSRDFEALCDFRSVAPHGRMAHPTWEHLAPLIFVAGAASAWDEPLVELYSGWTYGNLSMTSICFGNVFKDS